MGLQIKTPQSFVYVAKIPAAKKIKGIVFKHGVPVSVHDPKVIRLLARLPYMRAADDAAPAPKASAGKVVLEIPPDWRQQHWKRRKAWAKQISGNEIVELSDADQIIAAHVGEVAHAAPVLTPETAEAA